LHIVLSAFVSYGRTLPSLTTTNQAIIPFKPGVYEKKEGTRSWLKPSFV